ncbi:MAG: hypothetical protein NC200_07200 [Candidatus Gastranaerophilales bacterium]|nr:hypothetical protein [Candidatus Gastranaerophilales bacterium]
MFGDIKVDKLRFIYKKKEVSYEDRHEIHSRLKRYYPDSTTSSKTGFIQNTFTPTKLIRKQGKDNKHNLQIPSQELLYKTLDNITLNNPLLQEKCHNTLIHLTKDILLSKPVYEYIDMLSKRSYPYLITEEKASNNKPSLYLHYPYNPDSEDTCAFLIKFYDKVQEYYFRHGHYICSLYEPLTQDELHLAGNAYDEKTNTLNLENLNILRIEIEYHESKKILPLTKVLDPNAERLTTDLILRSLRAGIFNNTIEQIFNNTLHKHMFYANETLETATAGLSKVRELASKLLLKSSQTCHYKAFAEDSGLLNQFLEIDTITRKIKPESELYNELYNALFSSNSSVKEGGITEETKSVSVCKPYNSQTLKGFILIYEVPIWDDS